MKGACDDLLRFDCAFRCSILVQDDVAAPRFGHRLAILKIAQRAACGGLLAIAYESKQARAKLKAVVNCEGFRCSVAQAQGLKCVGHVCTRRVLYEKRPRRDPGPFDVLGGISGRGPCPNRSALAAARTCARAAGRAGSIPACLRIRSMGCSR
jgi:hypothetical protein